MRPPDLAAQELMMMGWGARKWCHGEDSNWAGVK